MFDHCPEGVKNLKEGEGYKRLEGLFKEEIEKMEKDTQMKIDGIFILQRVLDSIVTRVYFLLKKNSAYGKPIEPEDVQLLKGKSKGNIDGFGVIEGDRNSTHPELWYTQYRTILSPLIPLNTSIFLSKFAGLQG